MGLVYVAPMKKRAAVFKLICPVTHMFLKRIREGGVTACRRFTAGMMGESEILDEFTWLDGHLFPPANSTVRCEHMTNRAAVKAIERARASFSLPGVDDVQSIRTHSSRHHSIQKMKSNGVASDAGMAHARLRSPTVYLGYGARTDHELRPEYLHNEFLLFQNQRAYGATARAAEAAGADENCVRDQSGSCSHGAVSAALPAASGAAGARDRPSWAFV
jgi:hypothetical protein